MTRHAHKNAGRPDWLGQWGRRIVVLSGPVRYGVAIGAAAAAILFRLALNPLWGTGLPFVTLLPAIVLSAWLGGFGPGLITTLVTAVAVEYFWIAPAGSWAVDNRSELLGWLVFIVVGVVISGVNEAWRRGIAAAEREHSALLESERRTRREVELAARQLQAALQAGRMGTWQYTMATGEVQWSSGLEAIHGYLPGTFPGTFAAFRDEIHPADREHVIAAIAAAAEQQRDHHIEYRIVRRDGAVRWVEGVGQVLHDGRGRPDRMVGVCADVTERRHGEGRFRLAVEAAPAAMIMVDQHGTIVLVNALTERLLGFSRDELVGRAVDTLVPARFRGSHVAHRSSFLEHAEPRPMGPGRDLYALRKDGSEVAVEIGLNPIETDEGRFVLAAVADITARKQAEAERALLFDREQAARAELERANRMKDEFLAVLSHELRTPLSAVLGYSQILSSGVLPPDQVRHALEAIRRNAMAQARLIEALLDLSRITAGTFELSLHHVELSGVVDAAVDVLKPEADRKGVAIDVTVPQIDLVADGARLQQVLWNLLSNAVKFTPRGGRVRVQAARKDDQVRIQVSDTGRGIAPDFLPHLFERFRQAEPRDNQSLHGLGVGLTLVQEIVRAHSGAVAGESPGPGLGSTFTITLPVGGEAVPREPTPARERERLPSGLPIDVLVVDDDDDGREMLALLLETWGAVVRKASSAAEALRAIGSRRPDILLADLRMPGEDGFVLIQKIRTDEIERDQPRLPALAVTAHASARDRERAMAAGYDGHLAKPLDPGELARVLATYRNT